MLDASESLGRSDNCPQVPNPDQANRDRDKWGDACDLDSCHPACATGCTRPNDISTCTSPFYNGAWRHCKRCAKSYHSKGGKQGCAPGAPRANSKCARVPPTPTPVCPEDTVTTMCATAASGGSYVPGAGSQFACPCNGGSFVYDLTAGCYLPTDIGCDGAPCAPGTCCATADFANFWNQCT